MSTVGSSLAEARELYNLLQQCEGKFKEVERVARETRPSLNEAMNIFYQLVDTLDALGYGSNFEVLMRNLRRLMMMINMVRAAYLVLQATTPVGMLMGAAGMLTGAAVYASSQANMRM